MNIISKNLSIGDVVFDQAQKRPVKISAKNIKDLQFGVVSYQEEDDSFVFGYFTPNPLENILILVSSNFDTTVAFAMNKELFNGCLFFDNSIGYYKTSRVKQIQGDVLLLRGHGGFPYAIERNYEAEKYLDIFANSPKLDPIFTEADKSLIKYTFGLEFETRNGYIPQELCYRYGLIPVRDGSIDGVEYASIVLDNSDGLERVGCHLDLLRKYTSFNKECSYHVHMGGYPLDPKSLLALYTVWGIACNELEDILPKFAFKTSQYKASRKDYCRKNPDIFFRFDDLYRYMSGNNAVFAGSLKANHPQDPEKRAKWQIRQRYWAQSLIGMCFYEGPKTVEYRMLAPTYNYSKMIFWIYMFNAIMLYSEKIAREATKNSHVTFYAYKRTQNLTQLLSEVYPSRIVEKMNIMMEQLNHVVKTQAASGDLHGGNTSFEDSVIKPDKFIINKI